MSTELKLKADELIKVIKACRKSGVSVFKHGELQLVFHKQTPANETTEPREPSRDQVQGESPDKIQEVEDEGSIKQQIIDAEDRIDGLILEDPEKYEDMVAAGDFDDRPEQFEQTEEAI